jgi:hypothetical protein
MKKQISIALIILSFALLGFGIGNDLVLGYKETARAEQLMADGYADDAAWLLGLANESKQRGWILTVVGVALLGSGAFFYKKVLNLKL